MGSRQGDGDSTGEGSAGASIGLTMTSVQSHFKVCGAISLAVLWSVGCYAQNALPSIGQIAPELELSHILQAPAGIQPTLAALRGKAVVLEFWATWCGGCVAAIPHLNKLAAQFRSEPVIFLSVTDEGADVVRAFLKKRPINGRVGIDKDGATFRKYGIDGRPQTILIDAKGIFQGRASPERLDAALVQDWWWARPSTPMPA
jgi:thiol-disulfide isomerase/thioredoxin